MSTHIIYFGTEIRNLIHYITCSGLDINICEKWQVLAFYLIEVVSKQSILLLHKSFMTVTQGIAQYRPNIDTTFNNCKIHQYLKLSTNTYYDFTVGISL